MKPIRIGAAISAALVLSIGVIGMPGCSSTTTTDGGTPEAGGGDGGGGDGGSSCPTTVSCSNYCDFFESTCTGPNAGVDKTTCNSLCNKLGMANLGTLMDTSKDTVGCRMYHTCAASMSASNATTHCPHANIWSAMDTCGTQCDAFCTIEIATCTGANAQFGGMNECLSACGAWMAGKPTDTSGNTLGCREYHLGVASQSDANAAMHCPHTGNGSDAGANTTCGP